MRLEYFTIGYGVIESVVAVAAGLAAGSIALTGFGFDSLIEVTAALALWWRFRSELGFESGTGARAHAVLERKALQVIGITFYALAGYIILESGYELLGRSTAQESLPGIVLAAVSLAVMPVLATAKKNLARSIGSKSLESESKENWLCASLSLILLAGLLLNAVLGWSWADPVAALAMLPLIIHEGREAFEEAGEAE